MSYDPTFAYELAVIMQDGMRRMYANQEDVFYYLTVMNENYTHPAMPKGAEAGIIKGMYLFSEGKAQTDKAPKVQLLGSGTILREVIAAAELLEKDFGVAADIWSVTSFNELRRDGLDCERWNMLHPEAEAARQLCRAMPGQAQRPGDRRDRLHQEPMPTRSAASCPAATRCWARTVSAVPIRARNCASFFEVDRYYVAVAALKALADEGTISANEVSKAIKLYKINPDKPNPMTV